MLIVFDLDGVLLNASWEALYKGHEAIVADLGKNPGKFFKNMEEFKKLWSPDWRVTYERLGVKDEKKANEVFYQVYRYSVYPFYWVEEIVKKLLEKHLLAILTSSNKGHIDKHFRFLKNYFFLIISAEDVKKLKPDPEGLNKIARISTAVRDKQERHFIYRRCAGGCYDWQGSEGENRRGEMGAGKLE